MTYVRKWYPSSPLVLDFATSSSPSWKQPSNSFLTDENYLWMSSFGAQVSLHEFIIIGFLFALFFLGRYDRFSAMEDYCCSCIQQLLFVSNKTETEKSNLILRHGLILKPHTTYLVYNWWPNSNKIRDLRLKLSRHRTHVRLFYRHRAIKVQF